MIEQLLLLFQALFIAFLFLFIWMVIRSGRRDLRLAQESFVLAPAQAQKLGYETAPKARLVIETSPSIEPGRVFDVGAGAITIGRSVRTRSRCRTTISPRRSMRASSRNATGSGSPISARRTART